MAVNFEEENHSNQEESTHSRVERSASPILNDGSTIGKLNHFDSNDVESAGRYFSSINPTTTQDDLGKLRTGKDLMDEESFLGERGRRAKSSPAQNLMPSSVLPTEPTATKQPNIPRQNSNPDIQDIITGIVKLLNGNVNVHTNNGGTRRPPNNRINNRGPPRISEAQVPGNDIQEPNKGPQQPQSPYPFDRPEGPLRPFLTGVPLPEQIVPSMQQNFNRPGFVSQNRPPWKRPRPRPPFNANRRPIPPYRPIPSLPEYTKPEDEQYLNQNLSDGSAEKPVVELDTEGSLYDAVQPEEETSELTPSKDELKKRKTDKKPTAADAILPTPSVVTIIQSTSEVNMIQKLDGSFENSEVSEKPSFTHLESSISDVTSQSPVIRETPTLLQHSPIETPTSITSSQIVVSSSSTPPLSNQQQTQFHPRPGIVLDDPEFQPGKNSNLRPRPTANQQKPNLPPGYGEIFDITLSAIQGPNGNTGSQQTLNIKPYGTYEGSDIILSPSGDQAFVSIDGKRSYINLFGDSTDAPIISSSQVEIKPQIQPTGVLPAGVTGSGYVIAETEPTAKKPYGSQNRPVHRPRLPAKQPPVRIDTCIVGDDSTCDQAQHEKCKTESGVSSCHCGPGEFLILLAFLCD